MADSGTKKKTASPRRDGLLLLNAPIRRRQPGRNSDRCYACNYSRYRHGTHEND